MTPGIATDAACGVVAAVLAAGGAVAIGTAADSAGEGLGLLSDEHPTCTEMQHQVLLGRGQDSAVPSLQSKPA